MDSNFHNNSADFKGAIYLISPSQIINIIRCNFSNNSAKKGGVIYFELRGMVYINMKINITVKDCNFFNNFAEYGANIYFEQEGNFKFKYILF